MTNKRTRKDDFDELLDVLRHALSCALADGDGKHPAGSWMDESAEHHLDHAAEHVAEYTLHSRFEDASHGICRLAMNLRQLERKVRED